MTQTNFQQLANFIWSVADLLRGPYRPPQYERVMLPLTVLRRFDCVLEHTKDAVLEKHKALLAKRHTNIDTILNNLATDENGNPLGFHNHSKLDFYKLKGDPDNIGRHLTDYIRGFSENVQKIFERFNFEQEIEKLEEANRLYQVVAQFADMDLHPTRVDNITMGLVFEDLIRRFNEAANETAGDHFTPREVIQLMVNLLLEPDTNVLTQDGVIITICDPTCGTGGMLAEGQNWIRSHNETATVKVFGQDYNPRSYAVAASDLLIKGHQDSRIEYGNTLTDDQFPGMHFDYLLANPPFGVDWKAEQKTIERLPYFRKCYKGKLPRINDGALLFLVHMVDKFAPYIAGDRTKTGSRVAVVFNASPMFTGGAGSGESEIRRWIVESDMLEAIVALPEQMFYNTGINTFIWVLSNRKSAHRKGKVQLIDVRDRFTPMKKTLGKKRRFLDSETLNAVTREHGAMEDSSTSRIFDNAHFGYRRVSINRPLRLRFQITPQAKERYLNSCPEMFDALNAIEDLIGDKAYFDWNVIWAKIQKIVKSLPEESGWTPGPKGANQRRLFREAFTEIDVAAEKVIAKRTNFGDSVITDSMFPGQTIPKDVSITQLYEIFGLFSLKNGMHVEYEADGALKDYENVPLTEDIVSYFLREVRPHVKDAWIERDTLDERDNGVGKVGYEFNFNREFFEFVEPRPLKRIDTELEKVEKKILKLLQEVTE